MRKRNPISRALEHFSSTVTQWAGSSSAFGLAVLAIIIWIVTGPNFRFSNTWQLVINTGSNTWQLVINTGTTIVTFLMVFLIQRAQNKDSRAIHFKLNELVAAIEGASNRLIDIEDLDEQEMAQLHRYYCRLVEIAKKDDTFTRSHSVEEAEDEAPPQP
jgi:low affinity Fe/Cu permease